MRTDTFPSAARKISIGWVLISGFPGEVEVAMTPASAGNAAYGRCCLETRCDDNGQHAGQRGCQCRSVARLTTQVNLYELHVVTTRCDRAGDHPLEPRGAQTEGPRPAAMAGDLLVERGAALGGRLDERHPGCPGERKHGAVDLLGIAYPDQMGVGVVVQLN